MAMLAALHGLLFLLLLCSGVTVRSLSPPKGAAARPLDKKRVALLGAGGPMGALTFGFLQRACSLYGTGLGDFRTVGACMDTAARLNSYLSKHFCLAFANEANIKLTNLESVSAIQNRLTGWDALVLGTDLAIQTRKVTGGSYERTPNDKCNEIYWKAPSSFIRNQAEEAPIARSIVSNVLEAAQLAGIQHIVFVDEAQTTARDGGDDGAIAQLIQNTGIPYTQICPQGELVSLADYTYRRGVQGDLVVAAVSDNNAPAPKSSSSGAYDGRSYMEDVAALCVQSLLSLDWTQSRTLSVSTAGPASSALAASLQRTPKRPDQEWCVNSILLEQILAGVQ